MDNIAQRERDRRPSVSLGVRKKLHAVTSDSWKRGMAGFVDRFRGTTYRSYVTKNQEAKAHRTEDGYPVQIFGTLLY
ncbi:MAG: hypothetical protein ACYCRD_10250 [Leptospirillum sp.]